MEKTVIISDVHTHIDTVQQILDREKPDRTVFLGDWFDSFGDTPGTNARTAEWLLTRMDSHPADVFLWGNHDIHYGYPGSHTYCSGFCELKLAAISSVMPLSAWGRFSWFFMEGNWLFTHAGLNRALVPGQTVETLPPWLAIEAIYASTALRQKKRHWFFEAGRSRGGRAPFGGLVWCDYSEFLPIDGVNQLFGHTVGREVRGNCTDTSMNYCIDCQYGGVYAYFHGDLSAPGSAPVIVDPGM